MAVAAAGVRRQHPVGRSNGSGTAELHRRVHRHGLPGSRRHGQAGRFRLVRVPGARLRHTPLPMRNNMRRSLLAVGLLLVMTPLADAQPGVLTKQQLVEYTPDWKGERFPDGRPKVPDAILDRMKNVTLEEAWAVVTGAGFSHQYDDNWLSIHPEKVLVGRALTSQWLPGRPDILRVIEAKGRQEGRVGGTNAWPVDMLQPRDVYVSDHFGLKENGASVGDNVGSAIYAKSGNGIVYDGAVRDINGLKEMENFTAFVRSYDPSHHIGNASAGARLNSTMIGINVPIRIG